MEVSVLGAASAAEAEEAPKQQQLDPAEVDVDVVQTVVGPSAKMDRPQNKLLYYAKNLLWSPCFVAKGLCYACAFFCCCLGCAACYVCLESLEAMRFEIAQGNDGLRVRDREGNLTFRRICGGAWLYRNSLRTVLH